MVNQMKIMLLPLWLMLMTLLAPVSVVTFGLLRTAVVVVLLAPRLFEFWRTT